MAIFNEAPMAHGSVQFFVVVHMALKQAIIQQSYLRGNSCLFQSLGGIFI